MANSRNAGAPGRLSGARPVVGLSPRAFRSSSSSRVAALVLGAALFGCGARAAVDGSPDPEDEAGRAGSAGSPGAGGAAGGGGREFPVAPVGPIDLGGVTLPDCVPGEPQSSAGSVACTFLSDGACYDDPVMACACACRGREESRCIIGGFLNPDEPQRVRCMGR
jgi:hypothetical protein